MRILIVVISVCAFGCFDYQVSDKINSCAVKAWEAGPKNVPMKNYWAACAEAVKKSAD